MAPPSARPSALTNALSRVGDRWTLLVVDALLDGPKRFNDLQADLSGVASNVLSQRLKHLEAERVVVARPYQPRPLRYSYELTAAGHELGGVLRLLAQWGADHGSERAEGNEHAACGMVLEARWYCPTCDLVVGDEDGAHLRYL